MDTKFCSGCRTEKSVLGFSKDRSSKDGLQGLCKPCHVTSVMRSYYKNPEEKKKYIAKWQRANRKTVREYARSHKRLLRKQVFEHYGCKCGMCGESLERFLTIDHINGKGNEHREKIGGGGHTMYRWLIKNCYPPGYQTLCWNCNVRKHIGSLGQPNKSQRYDKELVFRHYGKTCSCCGESRLECLTVHRKRKYKVGMLYRWIIKHNFPKGIHTLCWNCNMAIRYNKICPHKVSP